MDSRDIAIPQLPSRSIEKTLSFYKRLGFKGEQYQAMTMRSSSFGILEIHFFLHETLRPEESVSSCYLRVKDVQAMYVSFSAANLPRKGIPRMEELENKPWGMKEFAVIDEDGTLIRIGQGF